MSLTTWQSWQVNIISDPRGLAVDNLLRTAGELVNWGCGDVLDHCLILHRTTPGFVGKFLGLNLLVGLDIFRSSE